MIDFFLINYHLRISFTLPFLICWGEDINFRFAPRLLSTNACTPQIDGTCNETVCRFSRHCPGAWSMSPWTMRPSKGLSPANCVPYLLAIISWSTDTMLFSVVSTLLNRISWKFFLSRSDIPAFWHRLCQGFLIYWYDYHHRRYILFTERFSISLLHIINLRTRITNCQNSLQCPTSGLNDQNPLRASKPVRGHHSINISYVLWPPHSSWFLTEPDSTTIFQSIINACSSPGMNTDTSPFVMDNACLGL